MYLKNFKTQSHKSAHAACLCAFLEYICHGKDKDNIINNFIIAVNNTASYIRFMVK